MGSEVLHYYVLGASSNLDFSNNIEGLSATSTRFTFNNRGSHGGKYTD